jgi:hypothetical protein
VRLKVPHQSRPRRSCLYVRNHTFRSQTPFSLRSKRGAFESPRLEETVELGKGSTNYLHRMSIYSTYLLPAIGSAKHGVASEETGERTEPLAARCTPRPPDANPPPLGLRRTHLHLTTGTGINLPLNRLLDLKSKILNTPRCRGTEPDKAHSVRTSKSKSILSYRPLADLRCRSGSRSS